MEGKPDEQDYGSANPGTKSWAGTKTGTDFALAGQGDPSLPKVLQTA